MLQTGIPNLVVTSIAAPNAVLRELAAGCAGHGWSFILIGDVTSPPDFRLDGCSYFGVDRQRAAGFALAGPLPTRHYARKNLGYLLAMRARASIIVETDDDNHPSSPFWESKTRDAEVHHIRDCGWVNVYGYFTDKNIWPRGLPLDAIRSPLPRLEDAPLTRVQCPIQQGLADENPDVDAVYRLVLPLPVRFLKNRVALGRNAWCPFNSQNTVWFPEAFGLMYLPSFCSFRMTDIWRSFAAQRIAWEQNWSVLFHEATVYQERNEHNLMRDFRDEVPGYLHNRRIGEVLDSVTMRPGLENIGENLLRCYEAMIRNNWIDARELALIEAWNSDVKDLSAACGGRNTA